MEKICWKEEYSVGVEILDNQHRRLLELVNQIWEHRDKDEADDALGQMVRYAKEHFSEEEKLMRQYGYAGLGTQKKQHAYFIDTTAELAVSMLNDKQATRGEIAEFLKLWWTTHILREDMKYKEFFKTRIPVKAASSS